MAVDGTSAPVHASIMVEASLPSATVAASASTVLVAPLPSSTDAASASSANTGESCPLLHADLTAQIRARAHTVSKDREWTSVFDLVVYACMRKRRVLCCFGAQVVDLVKMFAPWLEPCLDNTQRPARFLGCVASGGQLRVAK
jgi:hypothetical protein